MNQWMDVEGRGQYQWTVVESGAQVSPTITLYPEYRLMHRFQTTNTRINYFHQLKLSITRSWSSLGVADLTSQRVRPPSSTQDKHLVVMVESCSHRFDVLVGHRLLATLI